MCEQKHLLEESPLYQQPRTAAISTIASSEVTCTGSTEMEQAMMSSLDGRREPGRHEEEIVAEVENPHDGEEEEVIGDLTSSGPG